MKKVNQILNHPVFQEHLAMIKGFEKERIYCGHDLAHFLDVARIGYIYVLENKLKVDKEVVYGYGLLHDIGRGLQYVQGKPHEQTGAELARLILDGTEYTVEEKNLILSAILHHRQSSIENDESFEAYMYRADKASRACYNCEAENTCNWGREKKNMRLEV